MPVNIEIQVDDKTTPVLTGLLDHLTDLTELHRHLAVDLAEGTRRHIRQAAQTRHTTAERLGSRPTGYLSKAAETVEASGDADGVSVRVAGPIFKRVSGPVTITPREKKYLTIPVHADAVGKKAQEHWWRKDPPKRPRKGKRPRLIQGLVLIRSKAGNLLLARPNGDGSITPYYVLKTSVTLPQDEGLLPSPEQYGMMAERVAGWYLRRVLN
jgi:hypothetical protein